MISLPSDDERSCAMAPDYRVLQANKNSGTAALGPRAEFRGLFSQQLDRSSRVEFRAVSALRSPTLRWSVIRLATFSDSPYGVRIERRQAPIIVRYITSDVLPAVY